MDDASGQPDGKRESGIAASSACPAHGILDDRLAEQPIKATASGSGTAGLPGAIIDDLARKIVRNATPDAIWPGPVITQRLGPPAQ